MNAIIVFVAKYVYLLAAATFAGYFFFSLARAKKREFFIFSLFALPLSYFLGFVASHLYYDPRPFVVLNITPLFYHAADNGFPSDHALLLGTLAAIVTVFNKRLGIAMWALAIMVGAARVLAAVHHTLDIVASFAIAIIATYAVVLALKYKKGVVTEDPKK